MILAPGGEHAAPGAKVYSDDASAYEGLAFDHETVKHSLSEYVRGDVRTNGIESLWSMLKRAHTGTFHKISPKHLDRYVQEFAARHNLREQDTIDIMASLTSGMRGKRLRYRDLMQTTAAATERRSRNSGPELAGTCRVCQGLTRAPRVPCGL